MHNVSQMDGAEMSPLLDLGVPNTIEMIAIVDCQPFSGNLPDVCYEAVDFEPRTGNLSTADSRQRNPCHKA
jgi:hypothetical protein